jgi:tagatose 1,6-diphosphate aldolase
MHLGTVRRLTRLATTDGFLCIAAMDHPENYVELFDKDISRVPHETVARSKLELATELARHASGLLLDPVWSLGQAIATQTLPGTVGVVASIEKLSYTRQGFGLETALRPKWTAEKITKLGADGVKLYLSYRADITDVAAEQRRLVADLVSTCRTLQLPLIVEPIWYPLPGEDPTEPAVRRQRAAGIVAAATEFGLLGVDVLKVQFPGSVGSEAERASAAAAARDLDAGLRGVGRRAQGPGSYGVPWVLLSEGAGFDDFAVQMEISARAGASGYIAGRAVWADAVGHLPETERRRGLARSGERLDALTAIVRAHGRPWREAMSVDAAATTIPPDWYEAFGE